MENDNFYHLTSLLNAELRKANQDGLSVTVRTNGYPLQLKEKELAQIVVEFNDCEHEWITCEFLGKRVNGEITSPAQTYTVCNLCAMTK